MPRWMTLPVLAGWIALLAACSAGARVETPTTGAEPITFRLHIEDSGNALRIRPGDEVTPRLPLSGPDDPGWVLVLAPDPRVLGGGDDLRAFPSDSAAEATAYHEFRFVAVGPGEAIVVLTHGYQQFTFRVKVSADE